MPAVSKKQARFFQMLAHNKDLAKEKGMKPEKAAEMVAENKGGKSYKNLPEEVAKAASPFKKLQAKWSKGKK